MDFYKLSKNVFMYHIKYNFIKTEVFNLNWFYDKNGNAVMFLYTDMLISKNGDILCWIHNGSIYGIESGKHIGWLEEDRVYDANNNLLVFEKSAKGLPYMPGLGGTPGVPGIPGKPGRPAFKGIPAKPSRGGFSNYDPIDYFKNNK